MDPNSRQINRVGIFGGTFDPIHIGHLIIAEVARHECELDRLIFIPTGIPPHKIHGKVAPAYDRYEMTKIAIADNSHFEINAMEIVRKGTTYTIDTLRELRDIYKGDSNFFFIIGGDTLLEVRGWKESHQVLKSCHLVVYNRPCCNNKKVEQEAQFLREAMGACIHFVEGPLLDISSTDIRRRVRAGKSIRYLVPQKVEEYIYDKLIYLEG